MDLNPLPLFKNAKHRWRKPESTTSRRIALAAPELPDTALARLGRDARLAEAEQVRGFMRAGGGVVVHR